MSGLVSVIKNLSAEREYYDFLPPAGGYMERNAEIEFFGDVNDWIRKGPEHRTALEYALTQGKLQISSSPGLLIKDTVTGATREVSLASGTLTTIVPAWMPTTTTTTTTTAAPTTTTTTT